jgi:hypothetical protein
MTKRKPITIDLEPTKIVRSKPQTVKPKSPVYDLIDIGNAILDNPEALAAGLIAEYLRNK